GRGNILVKPLGFAGGPPPCAGVENTPDEDPLVQGHGQHIARPDPVIGARSPFGIDPNGAGFDEFLSEGARFDGAREKQEPVEPLLAERFARPCQSLLRLAAQGGKGSKWAVRIKGHLALFARRTGIAPFRTLVLFGTLALFTA